MTRVEAAVLCCLMGLLLILMVRAGIQNREQAQRTQCLDNLKQLGALSSILAQDRRSPLLPLTSKPTARAFEHWQTLVDWDPSSVPPLLFCCPAQDDQPADLADPDAAGPYTLSPSSCSYAIRVLPISASSESFPARTDGSLPVLACDEKVRLGNQREGHRGGKNVITVGLSAEWVPSGDLPAARLPPGMVGNEPD